MTFFQARGWAVGCLIHDGLHVQALLRQCEEHLFCVTGIRVQLKEKSLEPTQQDRTTLQLLTSARTLENEHDAAVEVWLHGVRLMHTTVGLAVFEPKYGDPGRPSCRLNSTVWKSVVSGGTDQLTCRLGLLHANAVQVMSCRSLSWPTTFPNSTTRQTAACRRTVSVGMDRPTMGPPWCQDEAQTL